MLELNPTLNWYTDLSASKGMMPRCPYAKSERCPGYFQSLSLLGHAWATKIPEDRDKQLQAFWANTDLWPLTNEQETSLSGGNPNRWIFSNFCPEVAFQHSGFFASALIPYVDEQEQEAALNRIPESHSYRWNWRSVDEMHYSECPLFSLLPYVADSSAQPGEEILEIKPSFGGFTLDIRRLLTRFSRWWLSRQRPKANQKSNGG